VIRIEEISKKIKAIRIQKKVTLKKLSEKTELSISFLSQVERGVSSLTVTSLKKIAEALDVSLQEIVSYEDESMYVHKKDNYRYLQLNNNSSSHQILSGKFPGKKLEGMIYTVEPECSADAFAHEGEEFHYIIEGNANFYIDGIKYSLDSGETIHFPSTLKHKIENDGKTEVKILSILTPPVF